MKRTFRYYYFPAHLIITGIILVFYFVGFLEMDWGTFLVIEIGSIAWAMIAAKEAEIYNYDNE